MHKHERMQFICFYCPFGRYSWVSLARNNFFHVPKDHSFICTRGGRTNRQRWMLIVGLDGTKKHPNPTPPSHPMVGVTGTGTSRS